MNMDIRVSYGTTLELGLEEGETDEKPTTAYLLIPAEACRGGCRFCPQAEGRSKWLSRVSWPLFDLEKVVNALEGSDFFRICVQSPDIQNYENKLISATKKLKDIDKPISISSPPLEEEVLEALQKNVERVGIGIDAATDELRKKKKPSYDPKVFWEYLGKAVNQFGEENVTAHLIVGLGEDLGELATTVKKSFKVGSNVSLFPYKREKDEAELTYYRKAQLITALLEKEISIERGLKLVSKEPKKAFEIIDIEKTFQTRGCPGCNRPYYTSSPGEEHKNFPRKPTKKEIEKIKKDIIMEED